MSAMPNSTKIVRVQHGWSQITEKFIGESDNNMEYDFQTCEGPVREYINGNDDIARDVKAYEECE